MTNPIADASPGPKARITGVVYLLYFLSAILAEVFMKGIVVSGDAAATANNIQAHEPLFRLGLGTGLIATAWYIALTALLYELFKPVNRSISLVAAFFSLVGCAIQAFGSVFQLAPLVISGSSANLSAFKPEQSQALALMFFKLDSQAQSITLVFFGLYCLLIGCLIFKSTFLPRILGALMALEQANRKQKVVVVGVDAIADALAAVRDGRLDATIFQDAKGQAGAAVETAVKLIHKQPVEKQVYIPFQLVTKENVGRYLK